MKGVVCAGGLGTRLKSLTRVTNKHLLPVYDEPMIFYPIRTLINSGVDEIMVVTGGEFAGHFIKVLKNGKDLGVKKLHYAYQEGNGGIADAISLAEEFADGDNIAVILGDNVTDASIQWEIHNFTDGAHLFCKQVLDPERFGVVFVDENGDIFDIVEKPKSPGTNLVATGLYIYDETVFDRIRSLTPSPRGELEVTDLNNLYLSDMMLTWSNLNGWWKDLGTFDSLLEAGCYWSGKRNQPLDPDHFINMGCI
jgi:glucose-1-phosphate thymidylyltransferase